MTGLGIIYEGWDGSTFDLREGPVRITDGGISGLLRIPTNTFVRTSPVVDGQQVTGWVAKPRPIMFPVDISAPDSLQFLALDRSFRKAIRPDRQGALTVMAPDGHTRSIAVRLGDNDDDTALPGDPLDEAGYTAVIDFIADNPWWLGPLVERTFIDVSPPDYGFYGPTGAGPSFYLTPASFTGRATVENPGDVDAWPLWEVLGPATGFRIEVAGQVIAATLELDADQRLVIDTDPEHATLRLYTGDEYTLLPYHAMDSIRFARIPDSSSATVFVLVYGGGSAKISFRPRYFGAY